MSNFADKIAGLIGLDVSKLPGQSAAAPHHFAADKSGPSFDIHLQKANDTANLNTQASSDLAAQEDQSRTAFKQANADYVAAQKEYNQASLSGDIAGMDKAKAKVDAAWDALQHAKDVRESFQPKWEAIAQASHSGEIDTLSAQVLQNLFKAPTENDKMAHQVAAKLLGSKDHSVQAGVAAKAKCNNGSGPVSAIGCDSGAPTKHVLTLLNSQPAALNANAASLSSAPIGREITIQSTGFQIPLASEAAMGPQPYSGGTAPTQLSGDQAVVFPGQPLNSPYVNNNIQANQPSLQLPTVSNGINPTSAGQSQNLAVNAGGPTAVSGSAITGNNSTPVTSQVNPGGNSAASGGSAGGPVQSGTNSSNPAMQNAFGFPPKGNPPIKASSKAYGGYTPQVNAENAYNQQTGNLYYLQPANLQPMTMPTGNSGTGAPVNVTLNPVSEGNSVATQTGTGSYPASKHLITAAPVSFPEGSRPVSTAQGLGQPGVNLGSSVTVTQTGANNTGPAANLSSIVNSQSTNQNIGASLQSYILQQIALGKGNTPSVEAMLKNLSPAAQLAVNAYQATYNAHVSKAPPVP